MGEHRPWLTFLLALASTAVLIAAQTNPPLAPSSPVEGANIYRHYCAACHGTDGRGHGPASSALKHAVPDLTRLKKRQKGVFPAQYVREVIEGKEPQTPSHVNREMPIWGPIFHQVEWDQDLGEVRLDAITNYVESIQQK